MVRLTSAIIFSTLTLMPTLLLAQGVQAIGRIISAAGDTQARSSSGELRTLSRRSEVFVEETIITGSDSFVQFRLIDSAILLLTENTEFTFEEYNFDGAGGNSDTAVMRLIRGGFRTITGTISTTANALYLVTSTFANIRVNNGIYECMIQEVLYCSVYAGQMNVANAFGSLDLNSESNGNYTEVKTDSAPARLTQRPPFRVKLSQSSQGTPNSPPAPTQPPININNSNNPDLPVPTPIIMVPVRNN